MSPPPTEPSAAPLHVAIVMDGNGRWAKRRGLPRSLGHRAGVESLKRTVNAAPDLNIRWLTMFGFSTENWSRPATEVSELMALPKRYFESDLARLEREGVRVRALGRREGRRRRHGRRTCRKPCLTIHAIFDTVPIGPYFGPGISSKAQSFVTGVPSLSGREPDRLPCLHQVVVYHELDIVISGLCLKIA